MSDQPPASSGQRGRSFRRWWWAVLLPLSWLLLHGVTVAWERRVVVGGYDSPEVVFTHYGFPLAYQMDSPYSSASWHWFLGPLLLDWAVYLLALTLLARWAWPRLRTFPLRPLSVGLWLLFVPGLGLTALDAVISNFSWTSPYTVLEDLGVRLVVGWVRD